MPKKTKAPKKLELKFNDFDVKPTKKNSKYTENIGKRAFDSSEAKRSIHLNDVKKLHKDYYDKYSENGKYHVEISIVGLSETYEYKTIATYGDRNITYGDLYQNGAKEDLYDERQMNFRFVDVIVRKRPINNE